MKKNRKSAYQFGNNQKKAFIAAANKFGCFNMKHFGDGYHFMDVDPSINTIICGTKQWDENETIFKNIDNLTIVWAKMIHLCPEKDGLMAWTMLAENLVSFMIHYKNHEDKSFICEYLRQQFEANFNEFSTKLQNGLKQMKDMLHNHTEIYKLQYDNVEEIFKMTNTFEEILLYSIVEYFKANLEKVKDGTSDDQMKCLDEILKFAEA